ncbi:zinc ribbon domain-containing protein [Flavobacterium sp. LS1R49]|uniref:Zinc ribbon domain-containing protein n=1 Tax=Flavobacterium shii TaxID=2987687 RepID=A0A9X2ZBQ8_9FLAO|nr:zinc ribbon domain-containing protein [Flavobacterium shii]MCV9928074.1 zinc ribbon domain-containing protein [Flavobacterium shii]
MCNTKTKLNLLVKGGFISVFFIPILPIKKDYTLNCDNCQKSIQKNSLNHIEKEKVINAFKSTEYKIPFLHFTGFLILLSVLSFAIYTGVEATKEEKIHIRNPEIGDLYRIKTPTGYTTFKVNKVLKDSVYVFINNMETTGYSGIDKININENYNELRSFSKPELLKMYDQNIIYQIDREILEP